MKPKTFVGSSTEGLGFAEAIEANLASFADVQVWNQDTFRLNNSVLDDLLEKLNESDYGIFIFSPSDETLIREKTYMSTRDNVLFEFGLYLGRLGKLRSFFLIPENLADFHQPTDLLGITPLTYNAGHEFLNSKKPSAKQLRQILLPACEKIKAAISKNENTYSNICNRLTGRLVYLLLQMPDVNRYYAVGSLIHFLEDYDSIIEDGEVAKKKKGNRSDGWSKAAEYALYFLKSLKIVQQNYSNMEFKVTEFGKRLLESSELKQNFSDVYSLPHK